MDPEIDCSDTTLGTDNACTDAIMETDKTKSSQEGVKTVQNIEEKNGSDEMMDTDEKKDELVEKENGILTKEEKANNDCLGDSKHIETHNHIDTCTDSDVSSNLNNTDSSKKIERELNSNATEIDSENKLDEPEKNLLSEKKSVLNGSPSEPDVNNEEPMEVDSVASVSDAKETNSSSIQSDLKEKAVSLDNATNLEEKGNSAEASGLKVKNESSESLKKNDDTLVKDKTSTEEKVVGMSPETIVSDDCSAEKNSEKNNIDTVDVKKEVEESTEEGPSLKVEVKSAESTKSKDKESGKKKKSKTCEECGAKKGLKFQVLFQGKTRFLCSDMCFKNFKSKQKKPAEAPQPTVVKCAQCQKVVPEGQGYYPVIGEVQTLCSEDCMKKYHDVHAVPKKCSQCKKVLDDPLNFDVLTWETMLFCHEDCLGKYQSFLGSHCTCCQSPVQQASLGKYCVCFGSDIRQFCSGSCLEEFKKGLKVCSFCQTDLSAGTEGFLAPVGDKGQFKDFCSQQCMERYEIMNNISTKNPPETHDCAYCKKQGSYRIQVKQGEKSCHFCCELCVAGYRCLNKLKDDMCDTCYKTYKIKPEEDLSLKLEGLHRHFCAKSCMTLFVLSHRKIVPCVFCKVKKYNFDMIEKVEANNQSQMFCSLNCLSLYRVSVNAQSAKSIRCDNCTKNMPAQYHLTMSDGSIRNFCAYQCVLVFQNQFTNVPALTTTSTTRQTAASSVLKTTSSTSTPVISNVVSLASSPRPGTPVTPVSMSSKLVPQKLIPVRQQSPIVIAPKGLQGIMPSNFTQGSSTITPSNFTQGASSTITPSNFTTTTGSGSTQIIREVIVKPPAPKSVKNKTVSCKPIMQTKGVSCKPHPCHKAVQTDDSPRPIILPIPVPIYVPTPFHMFSRPVPCPVPFPVPIPIPIIVPSVKEAPSQVMKHLKDIQDKTPSNPLEAELLKMAEIVAEDGSDKDKEPLKLGTEPAEKSEQSFSKNAAENSAADGQEESPSLEAFDEREAPDKDESEPEDEYVFKETKTHRKRSVAAHASHGKRRRKSRGMDATSEEVAAHVSTTMDDQNAAKENDIPTGTPRLKPIIGVNAWKSWVLNKNAEMTKGPQSSRKFKLFKTDLLQLAPDELNFSLSLFVQEARRKDGEEYTPGSLFYLLLGIQRYLFDNGRIDNIFTDPYYEKFTECLNNILCRQDAVYALEGNEPSPILEEYLWNSRYLGHYNALILLHTLVYFNTKYFKLKTVEDHFQLRFSHVKKMKKRDYSEDEDGKWVERLVYFPRKYRDYPRRGTTEIDVYEQIENNNALRCPVKLYEFYLSKCPESVKVRNDIFYLYPERSCVPDSPVWYSTQPLGQEVIAKMIQRIKFVRGVNDT